MNTEESRTNGNNEVVIECEEDHRPMRSLWDVIKLPWWEIVLVVLAIGATVTMFVLKETIGGTEIIIGVVVCSAILGLWLAFRPSEWAVDGLDNIMRYVGLTAYVAGVISSLASNLPEAVAAGILLVRGSTTGNVELIKTAFYTTLAAAGFNAILLGIVVLVGARGKGHIDVKKDTVMAEGVLLRWGFVATLLTFGLAVVEILDTIFEEVKGETFFSDLEGIQGELPRIGGIALVVSYIIYLVFLIVKSKQAKAIACIEEEPKRATKPTRGKLDEKMLEGKIGERPAVSTEKRSITEPDEVNIIDAECEETPKKYGVDESDVVNPYLTAPTMEHPHVTMGTAIVLVILGVGGIAGGGYLLSHAVEVTLHDLGSGISIELMALIVGFSGAIPEHGVAVVAAAKGKTDVALGNILGGILQMTLLVFGAFASIVLAPINDFMLFQIIALAGIIWFVKRSLADDHRITTYEGIMIILAQCFAFVLLVFEFA